MSVKAVVKEVASKFKYRADSIKVFDWWYVMRERDGKLHGDCDDFSLTVLWMMCNRSVLQFLWKVIISHQYRLYFAKTRTGGIHCVGYAEGCWFDNWSLKAMPKEEFLKRTGHTIKYLAVGPHVLFNMLLGIFVRNKT